MAVSTIATETDETTVDLPRERVAVLLEAVRAGVAAMQAGTAQQAYDGDERLELAYEKAAAAVAAYERARQSHFRRARALLSLLEKVVESDDVSTSYVVRPELQRGAVAVDVWSELIYLLLLGGG